MKKNILFLALCFVALIAGAQQKADIMVGYNAYQPNMKNGQPTAPSRYVLLANAAESKFYSPRTEQIDSLNSTPEGKAAHSEMVMNAYRNGRIQDIPRRDGTYYVTTSRTAGSIVCYDRAGQGKYVYEEPITERQWQTADSTKTILGYECMKATATLYGRTWTVWFAPEIPLSAGPWKIYGLPGLVLEAEAEGGQYRFEATGIQQTDKEIRPVYLADEYEKTTRIDFLKSKRAFLDNPMGSLTAQLGSNIVVKDASGNDLSGKARMYAPREVVDFIETDY